MNSINSKNLFLWAVTYLDIHVLPFVFKIKIILSIIFSIVLFSCNPLEETRLQSEINYLVEELNGYGAGTYNLNEINDDRIRSLNIDLVIKNVDKKNPLYSGFIEENDSLIILVNKSGSILETEKRIIYDFAAVPRNFGSEQIIGASYSITQLNQRLYFAEVGFD